MGAMIELLIPVWAEFASPTTWYADHIRERYGLFTIIVLGESILATSMAIQSVINEGALNGKLISVILGGLLIVYSMWWLYFYQPADYLMTSLRHMFIWSYSHLLIFGATAAVGAGVAVVIDQVTHHVEISATGAGLAVALPVAIYVFCLWVVHEHTHADHVIDRFMHPFIILLILLNPFTKHAVPFTGVLLALLVAIRLIRQLD
jgi:low temperature requirement protein LtrA